MPKVTQADPVTGIQMCQDCWNGKHPRDGCRIYECKCGCYRGRNKGLACAHYPAKSCAENAEFPDCGTIEIK